MYIEKYRTGLKRIWAAIVDAIVFMPLLLVEQWMYRTTDNISIWFIWATFVSFAPVIYSVILHYRNGQTIGKWVAGVKVMDISETRKLTLLQSIWRDSFYLLVSLVGLIYYGFYLTQNADTGIILSDYISFSDNPVFLWTIVELITMLTNSKRRALHDFIAKSVVVRTETSS
jgi:uncharacterized RDD family membrane protein YckC